MSTAQVNELKTIDGTKSVQVADIADGNVGIGVGQTWQDVTEDRALGTEYTNDTGRPIIVSITHMGNSGSLEDTPYLFLIIDGLAVSRANAYNQPYPIFDVSSIVPAGSTYSAEGTLSTAASMEWSELREVV